MPQSDACKRAFWCALPAGHIARCSPLQADSVLDHAFVPIRRKPDMCNECRAPITVHKFKRQR